MSLKQLPLNELLFFFLLITMILTTFGKVDLLVLFRLLVLVTLPLLVVLAIPAKDRFKDANSKLLFGLVYISLCLIFEKRIS